MPYKILLSSTRNDLLAEREAVQKAIVALEQNFAGMEYFFAREETPLETCLIEVANSSSGIATARRIKTGFRTRNMNTCAGELGLPRCVSNRITRKKYFAVTVP